MYKMAEERWRAILCLLTYTKYNTVLLALLRYNKKIMGRILDIKHIHNIVQYSIRFRNSINIS